MSPTFFFFLLGYEKGLTIKKKRQRKKFGGTYWLIRLRGSNSACFSLGAQSCSRRRFHSRSACLTAAAVRALSSADPRAGEQRSAWMRAERELRLDSDIPPSPLVRRGEKRGSRGEGELGDGAPPGGASASRHLVRCTSARRAWVAAPDPAAPGVLCGGWSGWATNLTQLVKQMDTGTVFTCILFLLWLKLSGFWLTKPHRTYWLKCAQGLLANNLI